MKKIFLYIIILIFSTFFFPLLFTSRFSVIQLANNQPSVNEEDIQNAEVDKTPYNYSKYKKINLLNSNNGECNELELDEYLCGVVSAEMPASYDIEALKAQAVVARTYTIYTIEHSNNKHGDGTICTSSSCCQAWISKDERMEKWKEEERVENWEKIEEAVYSTKGKIIEYNGEVIDAFFHSNSGGKTEIPENVWGGSNYPYLKAVETSGEDAYSQYSSEVSILKNEFEKKMKEKYKDFNIDWKNEKCIDITEYTDSGRARSVKIGNKTVSGVEVREIFGLKSANFSFYIDGNNVNFYVKGYGHGVGMSQTGADALAKNGSSYSDIIKHFYTDVEIINM